MNIRRPLPIALALLAGLTLGAALRAGAPPPALAQDAAPSGLVWEEIGRGGGEVTHRSRIPTGWLVRAATASGLGLTYVPDPAHSWDGKSSR